MEVGLGRGSLCDCQGVERGVSEMGGQVVTAGVDEPSSEHAGHAGGW